ncbi:MAG: VPDSG-CTERM sorting domain-containing protein [Verrucomicrobiota bacterium]
MKIKSAISNVSQVAVAAFFAASSISDAAVVSWEVTHAGSPLDFLSEKWGNYDGSYDLSYSETWDIKSVGYNPLTQHVDGITVWFAFADDSPHGSGSGSEISNGGDIEEYVDISLGGTKIWDNLEVDGAHPASSYTYYSMVLDPITHLSIFNDLKADGTLSYSVLLQDYAVDSGYESKYGEDTYLKVAKIKAWYNDEPVRVPNGGRVPDAGTSVALLGLSLASLVGLRRKLA